MCSRRKTSLTNKNSRKNRGETKIQKKTTGTIRMRNAQSAIFLNFRNNLWGKTKERMRTPNIDNFLVFYHFGTTISASPLFTDSLHPCLLKTVQVPANDGTSTRFSEVDTIHCVGLLILLLLKFKTNTNGFEF